VCVIEGPDLLDAALSSGASVETLFVDVTATSSSRVEELTARTRDAGVEVVGLESGVLAKIADAQTPQPVMATVRFRVWDLAQVPVDGFVLILDNLRDPGNVGTIIRSADAAGARAVILSGDCVDPFNPKTLRASAGSVFYLPLALSPLGETLDFLRERAVPSYATVVRGATSFRRCRLAPAAAVVIGNEAAGLDAASVALCDATMSIEMAGRAESLNAGVAASLIAFEALRQRSDTIGA